MVRKSRNSVCVFWRRITFPSYRDMVFPEEEGEIEMKGYVRFQNGIVAVSQIEGFSWKRLKPGDPLLEMWERQNYTQDVYSVVIFLKGSNKFMTTTTQKNLDQMVARVQNMEQWR